MGAPMNSRDRVRVTVGRGVPDRVPIDYAANPGIDARLKAHFGLGPGDDEGLLQRLGVDFRYVTALYRGPELHAAVPDRRISEWGDHRRWR